MKKLILLLTLATLFNCSKEDECECDMRVYTTNGTTNSSYIVTNVPSDCEGNVTANRDIVPSNHFPTMRCE